MNEDLDKLKRMLEQATAAPGQTPNDPDPEHASLGEAWTALGRLLEAANAAIEPAGRRWTVPPPRPRRRWLLPAAAAALAASVLVAIAITWTSRTGREPARPIVPSVTASTNVKHATPATNGGQTAPIPAGPQWNDSWDEQLAQVGRNVTYVEQGLYAGPDPLGAVQYGIEQMQKDIAESKL